MMERDDPPFDPVTHGSEDPRREVVAEAFHTFGEDVARQIADKLGIRFEDCREDIERLRHRLQ